VNIAISRAAVTIDSIRSVHIEDVSAAVEDGAVSQWRVKITLSFAVQDKLHE
jgi:flavin-binding protein dodecin